MLPRKIYSYINTLPIDKTDEKYFNLVKEYQQYNITIEDNELITQEERRKVLLEFITINEESSFFELFLNGFEEPKNRVGEELLSLEEIYDYYKDPSFWWDDIENELKEKYPKASKRYLQITSIEGEGSYFYDKQTDYVYDVDWGQEEDMITGKLKPWFTSFYDFLEWYYSEEDEDKNEFISLSEGDTFISSLKDKTSITRKIDNIDINFTPNMKYNLYVACFSKSLKKIAIFHNEKKEDVSYLGQIYDFNGNFIEAIPFPENDGLVANRVNKEIRFAYGGFEEYKSILHLTFESYPNDFWADYDIYKKEYLSCGTAH